MFESAFGALEACMRAHTHSYCLCLRVLCVNNPSCVCVHVCECVCVCVRVPDNAKTDSHNLLQTTKRSHKLLWTPDSFGGVCVHWGSLDLSIVKPGSFYCERLMASMAFVCIYEAWIFLLWSLDLFIMKPGSLYCETLIFPLWTPDSFVSIACIYEAWIFLLWSLDLSIVKPGSFHCERLIALVAFACIYKAWIFPLSLPTLSLWWPSMATCMAKAEALYSTDWEYQHI
jgi:hypothetical protein